MPAHRQYYEILGLDEPPADRKAVKRAYSKMLKVTRPEEDPDGFMRLRDAHDQALNILKWQAEDEAWKKQQAVPMPQADVPDAAELPPVEPVGQAEAKPGLTYSDMVPPAFQAQEPESETSYSIGPTPNLDAPVTPQAFTQTPTAEPLIEELNAILDNANLYNDREAWNALFRKARQLDIDDYVDFENLLLDSILRFHGYYQDNPHFDTPEKMTQKLSPSIAASLFKTMSWDQVNTQGYHRSQQIEWLNRRMRVRRRGVDTVPTATTKSDSTGKVWIWMLGAFIILKIIQALVNA